MTLQQGPGRNHGDWFRDGHGTSGEPVGTGPRTSALRERGTFLALGWRSWWSLSLRVLAASPVVNTGTAFRPRTRVPRKRLEIRPAALETYFWTFWLHEQIISFWASTNGRGVSVACNGKILASACLFPQRDRHGCFRHWRRPGPAHVLPGSAMAKLCAPERPNVFSSDGTSDRPTPR